MISCQRAHHTQKVDNIFPSSTVLQLHIVHMKHHYSNLSAALLDKEGVAVLGFFYEVTIKNNQNIWIEMKI